MTRRTIVPVASLLATFGVLAGVAIVGDSDTRAGALLSIASLALAFKLIVRHQRAEFEPDEVPSDLELLADAFEGQRLLAPLLPLYILVFVVFDDAGALGAAVAAMAVVATGVSGARASLRRGGVERDRFLLSTSIAFVVTMGACGAWSMFEAFADAPELSMVAPWGIGLVAWVGTSLVLERRAA